MHQERRRRGRCAMPAAESGIVPSPDRTRVAFVRASSARAASNPALREPEGRPGQGRGAAAAGRGGRASGGAAGGEIIVRTLADGRETLVQRADEGPVGGLSWSPDGQTLVFNDANPAI